MFIMSFQAVLQKAFCLLLFKLMTEFPFSLNFVELNLAHKGPQIKLMANCKYDDIEQFI